MVTDADAADAALRSPWEDGAFGRAAGRVRVSSALIRGPRVIPAPAPVVEASDTARMDLRPPSRMTGRLVAALGGNPAGMAVTRVVGSRTCDAIDRAIRPWDVTGAIGASELALDHAAVPWKAPCVAICLRAMNRGARDLPADDLRAVAPEQDAEIVTLGTEQARLLGRGQARDRRLDRGGGYRWPGRAGPRGWRTGRLPAWIPR